MRLNLCPFIFCTSFAVEVEFSSSTTNPLSEGTGERLQEGC